MNHEREHFELCTSRSPTLVRIPDDAVQDGAQLIMAGGMQHNGVERS